MPATPSYTVAASVPDCPPSALELFLHTPTTEPQRTGIACFIGASVERPATSAAAFDLSDRTATQRPDRAILLSD